MDLEDKKKGQFESQTLCKLCINRKIQNFDALKEWDQARAYHLTTHRKIADQIEQALQFRIAESNQYLQVVIQYLSDISNQLKKHEAQSIANPEIKLTSNLISRNIQLSTSKILIRLYNTIENMKQEKELCELLEESKKKLQKILNQSNLHIMEIRIKVEMKVVEIQNENQLTHEQCDQVLATYNDNKLVKMFHTEQDFFFVQHLFLMQTIKQMSTQEMFGLLIVQLLQSVQQYEKDKLQTVRQILQNYLIALEQTSQLTQNIKFLLDILQKRTQHQILNAFYSPQQLISQQQMKDLRHLHSLSEHQKFDLAQLKSFLTKITYSPFNNRNLILKQYKTYLQLSEELQNSYLIITIDAFLHIYLYKDHFELQTLHPIHSFKCNNTLQMRNEGEVNLYIQVKKWQLGTLTKPSPVSICIVFVSEDQREQFKQFASKIII